MRRLLGALDLRNEGAGMIFEPFKPFLASAYRSSSPPKPWERRGARRCADEVFCEEQGLFDGDDRDAVDDIAIPLVAVSLFGVAAMPWSAPFASTRDPSPAVWWGSRLAVAGNIAARRGRRRPDPPCGLPRRMRAAAALPRQCAEPECRLCSSTLHWRTLDEVELHGRPHHAMQADLDHYPPFRQRRNRLPVTAETAA